MSPRTKIQFEEIRKEKKQLILSTALKLFADNGYHTTSISRIAKEAKISKGLIYNYFESKESILASLFQDYIEMVSLLINPNDDNEISSQEMESFFDLLKKSLIAKNEYWRLFTRLSLQQDVFDFLFHKLKAGQAQIKHQELLCKYFYDRFDDADVELFYFSALIKGFTIQYLYASEMFADKIIEDFLKKIKNRYIKPKIR